jgi:hypothetical protein
MAIIKDQAGPCNHKRHPWWINRRFVWLNCKLSDGELIGSAPTVALLISLWLDRRSLDFNVWLGWLGFRVWWHVPQWWTACTTSGFSLWWGREPIVEGARFSRHEVTQEWPVDPAT